MTTDPLADIRAREAQVEADDFNRDHPVGSAVVFWPGYRTGAGIRSRTRSRAQLIGETACVWVEGYPGRYRADPR